MKRSLREEAARFSQRLACELYEQASRYALASPWLQAANPMATANRISICQIQSRAAETAHHARWLLGVEADCRCAAHVGGGDL
jgi:hypothetical protein